MTTLKTGDIVWVRTGLGTHEEPAKILELSCHYQHPYECDDHHDDGNDKQSSNQQKKEKGKKNKNESKNGSTLTNYGDNNNDNGMKEKKETEQEQDEDLSNADGILVRYTVSLVEGIVHRKNVRTLLMDDEEQDRRSDGNCNGNDNYNGDDLMKNRRRRSTRNRSVTVTFNPTDMVTKDKDSNGSSNSTAKGKKEKKQNIINETKHKKERETKHNNMEKKDNDDNVTLSNLKSKKTTKKRKLKNVHEQSGGDDYDEVELSKSSKSSSSALTQTPKIEDVMDGSNVPSSTRKKRKKATNTKHNNEPLSIEQESKSSPYFKNQPRSSESNNDDSTPTAATTATTATTIKSKAKKNKNPVAGKPDGNGGLPDPSSIYIIEYAKTGRSTCKRCDQKIQKNDVRVGHRPLFRGKPGFRIYKHLNCIVFSSDIRCVEDVDGYDDLTKEDCDILEKRIKESLVEIREEDEALDPDELVQKAFEGEMRDKPRGLIANLLPFQKEGCSWMYCQEVNVPEIKGGILADEMVS